MSELTSLGRGRSSHDDAALETEAHTAVITEAGYANWCSAGLEWITIGLTGIYTSKIEGRP